MGRFVGCQLKTGQYIVVVNGEIVAARAIRRMLDEERCKAPEKVLDVGIVPWDQPGRARAEVVRLGGNCDREGQAPAPVLSPHCPRAGHSRWVYLKRSDFLDQHLSKGCPGCWAVKLGIRTQGHSAACCARMEDALLRTESDKQHLEIAVDSAHEVVSEEAAKRAMLQYGGVRLDTEGTPSQSEAASSGDLAGSALSGMAVATPTTRSRRERS